MIRDERFANENPLESLFLSLCKYHLFRPSRIQIAISVEKGLDLTVFFEPVA